MRKEIIKFSRFVLEHYARTLRSNTTYTCTRWVKAPSCLVFAPTFIKLPGLSYTLSQESMVSARVSVWGIASPSSLGICVLCYCCVFGCWMFEWYYSTYLFGQNDIDVRIEHSLHVLYFTARGSIISRAVSIFYRNVLAFATHCTLSVLRLITSASTIRNAKSRWRIRFKRSVRWPWRTHITSGNVTTIGLWMYSYECEWRDMIRFEFWNVRFYPYKRRNSIVPLLIRKLVCIVLVLTVDYDQYNWHRFL